MKLIWIETARGLTWELIDLDGGKYGRIDYSGSPDYLGYYSDHPYQCYSISAYGQLIGFDHPVKTLASAKIRVRNQVKRDLPWRVLA